MEASFWSTLETYPQQASLGIITLLISRRSLLDSISRSLEVLYEMPYTTTFPPGLPADLEQILRDLHTSTERLLEEVSIANRLLHRLALLNIHLMLYRPSLGFVEVLRYHTYPILTVRALLQLPSALSSNLSFHQGHKPPSSIAHPSTKHAACGIQFM